MTNTASWSDITIRSLRRSDFMSMCLRELIEFHEQFIKAVMSANKCGLAPQMVYKVMGQKQRAVVFAGDMREGMLYVYEKLRCKPVMWLITMNEAYADRTLADMGAVMSHVPGSLQKRFEAGDKSVEEVIIMNVYTKNVKLSIEYDKNMNKIRQTDEFEGLLTVSDIDRLFWASSGLEGQVD